MYLARITLHARVQPFRGAVLLCIRQCSGGVVRRHVGVQLTLSCEAPHDAKLDGVGLDLQIVACHTAGRSVMWCMTHEGELAHTHTRMHTTRECSTHTFGQQANRNVV